MVQARYQIPPAQGLHNLPAGFPNHLFVTRKVRMALSLLKLFISPMKYFSACMIDLMIGGLKQKLTTQVYPAEVADLSYSINPSQAGTGQGISIMVAGYNQNLPVRTLLLSIGAFNETTNIL